MLHIPSPFANWLISNQIAEKFGKLEEDALMSGNYFLNLHIVTGRKPLRPRPGDMLLDGTLQGFENPYADMSHYPVTRATHWERYAKYNSPQYS